MRAQTWLIVGGAGFIGYDPARHLLAGGRLPFSEVGPLNAAPQPVEVT